MQWEIVKDEAVLTRLNKSNITEKRRSVAKALLTEAYDNTDKVIEIKDDLGEYTSISRMREIFKQAGEEIAAQKCGFEGLPESRRYEIANKMFTFSVLGKGDSQRLYCKMAPVNFEAEKERFQKTKNPAEIQPEDSIAVLGMSARTTNCLIRRGIRTIEDLLALENSDYARINNLGTKGLREIEEALETLEPEREFV